MAPEPVGNAHGVITKNSSGSVADTVARLKAAIQAKGLTLFAVIDHSGEATRAGLKMNDTKLLIFGSPAAGTPLMVERPLSAIDLPLKALVWQDQHGQVFVSFNSSAYIVERHGLSPDLLRNISGAEALIERAAGAEPAH